MPVTTTTATLPGALRVNYILGIGAYEDVGGRLQALISQVTALESNIALLQAAALSTNASGVTFSSLSGVTFATYSAIQNFAST